MNDLTGCAVINSECGLREWQEDGMPKTFENCEQLSHYTSLWRSENEIIYESMHTFLQERYPKGLVKIQYDGGLTVTTYDIQLLYAMCL